jgi:adenylate cyclase
LGFKQEIERKFLIHKDKLPPLPPPNKLAQGYLSFTPVVRIRTEEKGDGTKTAYITIKGGGTVGRDEFEYEIPFDEGQHLLKMTQATVVRKNRYIMPLEGAEHAGLKWELDIFEGENEGLIVAELEMPDENYPYPEPDWLGDDVTDDRAYTNAALARHPFREWNVDKDS